MKKKKEKKTTLNNSGSHIQNSFRLAIWSGIQLQRELYRKCCFHAGKGDRDVIYQRENV